MLSLICAWAVGLTLWQAGAHAATPSFNCAKASAPDELAKCADNGTGQLGSSDHNRMAATGEDKESDTRIAREFIPARQACASNGDCIRKQQEQALVNFRAGAVSDNDANQFQRTESAILVAAEGNTVTLVCNFPDTFVSGIGGVGGSNLTFNICDGCKITEVLSWHISRTDYWSDVREYGISYTIHRIDGSAEMVSRQRKGTVVSHGHCQKFDKPML